MNYKKSFFSLICLFISILAAAKSDDSLSSIPTLPLIANRIVYTDTVKLDSNYTKEKLFNNAQAWYRADFETSDNTLTINNSSDGELNGTGIIHDKQKEIDPKDVFFTIDIVVMKGAYVYRVSGIAWMQDETRLYFTDMYNEELYPRAKNRWTNQYRHDMLINMNDKINAMLAHLKESMMKSK